MKILFLAAANSIHTVKWVNALTEKGNQVYLVFINNHSPKENTINENVKQYKLKYSGNIGYYLNSIELRKIYEQINPDIVNAHYASGYGTLARVSKLKPLVLSVWGSDVYDFPYENIIKKRILLKNLNYADKIASTSNSMAQHTRQLLNNNWLDIAITPFGVDLKKFNHSLNKYRTDKRIIIGNVKTLSRKYGIDYLIRAFEIVVKKLKVSKSNQILDNLYLYIYGDGEDKNKLIRITKELNLENKVCFKGKIPNNEVPMALSQMDIFCCTSLLDSESFGVAAVEAMSMGLPVVATDVSGFKEVVEDNVTGYIVKRDVYDIADKLYKLLQTEDLRHKLGNNGINRVKKLYDWDDNVNTMISVYNSLIKCPIK